MAARKMNFKEMKELLINFESMDKHEKECLAKGNKMTVKQLKSGLEKICYNVENLEIMQKKALLKEMQGMNAIKMKMIEEVNEMTCLEITELLTVEINAYDEFAKRKREYKKLLKIEMSKVKQEMIRDGIIIVESFGVEIITDICEHRERVIKTNNSVARKCGLTVKNYYDPFIGMVGDL